MQDTALYDSPALAIGDATRYLVRQPQEIVRILRGLLQRRELVSAFFNAGEDLLLTAVLEVDPDNNTLVLDYGGNEALNQRLLEAERVIYVTALDRVKVQFVGPAPRLCIHAGRPAFRTVIPQEVMQLQRREFYRLQTPIANPLLCRVPLPEQQWRDMVLLDISAGGIAMQVELADAGSLDIGAALYGCHIGLPGGAPLEVTLQVRNRYEITLRNGRQALRVGCQFVSLHPALQATIQRYIVRLQRERIAHSPGR